MHSLLEVFPEAQVGEVNVPLLTIALFSAQSVQQCQSKWLLGAPIRPHFLWIHAMALLHAGLWDCLCDVK